MTLGRSVTIGSGPKVYLPAGAEIPDEVSAELRWFTPREDPKLREHPRIRRILRPFIRPQPLYYSLLHWSDGTDLEAVDARVMAGEVRDEDFYGALIAQAPSQRTCTNCLTILTLIDVDPADALYKDETTERIRRHTFTPSCPVCGELTIPPLTVERSLAATPRELP